MGFYLGTSLSTGPFRLSLSPSGISISAGLPGFRAGAGPRGNFVRVSGLGTYYAGVPRVLPPRAHDPDRRPLAQPGEVVLQDLNGASVQQLVAAHPSDIVGQLRAATRRVPLWPFAAGATVLLVLLTVPFGLALLLPGVPAVVWLYLRDRARRSVVVFYQVDGEPATRFERLTAAHHFLPDRALLRQGSEYAELPYDSLRVSAAPQRFVESGAVPRDSRVVDTTWQYANVRGGPDRRFKNNRQLPVMLYGRLTLHTPAGFYMAWDFSRPEAADALADAIHGMAR
ncbi:DUF4236 domain-containing protein [Phytohabitans suffuscus]|uniref:DUF4236 domain-containing protein n=1 Tax=Phytohabitans suffuscus TaxID=624315 RepID=A0A6F8YYP3_9ACTN|nr:DUF4236 domain-containing protein [Phytohabitans suffuscus]BCB91184.1 hypothetical protein Psuf_084970 [Phytohabitans suffuscus]